MICPPAIEALDLDASITPDKVAILYQQPLNDLLLAAQSVLRQHFAPNQIQVSTLTSIKTGRCPEDCGYCSQSAHHQTNLTPEKTKAIEDVLIAAKQAKDNGATRFCMGAAWKNPHNRDLPYLTSLIQQVKQLGLETCMTLGMLTAHQADQLANSGLDYYNHNLDTSERYYPTIVTTRQYQDRLNTLNIVGQAGIAVCCGGIIGMGESRQDRVDLITTLANLPTPPKSVPINLLVPIDGTPLGQTPRLPTLEWIRTIAVTRLCLPSSYVRLSAGRETLTESEQALAFMAGANSFFYGEQLLTTSNHSQHQDIRMLADLGLDIEPYSKIPAPYKIPSSMVE